MVSQYTFEKAFRRAYSAERDTIPADVWEPIKDGETKSRAGYERCLERGGTFSMTRFLSEGERAPSLFRSRRHAEMDPDQNASVCFFWYQHDRKRVAGGGGRRRMEEEGNGVAGEEGSR